VQDNAGTVTNIVLGDVTGESWIYGIGYGKRIKGNLHIPSNWNDMSEEKQKEYSGVRVYHYHEESGKRS
jgi:hypothetical protein